MKYIFSLSSFAHISNHTHHQSRKPLSRKNHSSLVISKDYFSHTVAISSPHPAENRTLYSHSPPRSRLSVATSARALSAVPTHTHTHTHILGHRAALVDNGLRERASAADSQWDVHRTPYILLFVLLERITCQRGEKKETKKIITARVSDSCSSSSRGYYYTCMRAVCCSSLPFAMSWRAIASERASLSLSLSLPRAVTCRYIYIGTRCARLSFWKAHPPFLPRAVHRARTRIMRSVVRCVMRAGKINFPRCHANLSSLPFFFYL